MAGKLVSKVTCAALTVVAFAGSRATYAAPLEDPCSLLTPEQVSSVLGVKVGEGQHISAKACVWTAPVKAGAPSKKVTITLQGPQSFAYAKMPIGNGITKSDVNGIGDDAVYVSAPSAPTTLTVKKGNVVFTIIVARFSDDQIKAKEKTLALDVVAKL